MPQIESSPDTPIPAKLLRDVMFFRNKFKALLYPNTPVEVEVAEDRYHFFCEGVWDSWEATHVGAGRRVKELLSVNNLLWTGQTLRLDPGWSGWKKIDQGLLDELLTKFAKYDASLE